MSLFDRLQSAKAEKIAANKTAGEAFIAQYKQQEGVTELPSGLIYRILEAGDGDIPGPKDTVECHYHGTLIDGTVFDSSIQRGRPAQFPVNAVIKSWVEALQLMPAGSTWELVCRPELAYGDQQAGSFITPGSTLIFKVQLLRVL